MKSPLIKSWAMLLAANLAVASLPSSIFANGTVMAADAVSLPPPGQAHVTTLEFQQIVADQLAQFNKHKSYAPGLMGLHKLAGTPSVHMFRLFPEQASARTLLRLLTSEKTSRMQYSCPISYRKLRRKLGKDNFSAIQEMNRKLLRAAAENPSLQSLVLQFPRGFPSGENMDLYSIEALERDLNKFFDNSIARWLKIEEPRPVRAASRSMFSWPQTWTLKSPPQELPVSKPAPRPAESTVENLPSVSPHAIDTGAAPKISLAVRLHAALSIAYAVGLSLFAAYRLATEQIRYGYYKQIAIAAKHHQHVWTLWEKFNLGGLNDFITVPAAMAMVYVVFLAYTTFSQDAITQASRRAKGLAMSRIAILSTLFLEAFFSTTLLKLIGYHGTTIALRFDLMNVVTFGTGGVLAALLGYALWWPKNQENKITYISKEKKSKVGLERFLRVLASYSIGIYGFCYFLSRNYGWEVGLLVFSAVFAVPLTLLFFRRKHLGL